MCITWLSSDVPRYRMISVTALDALLVLGQLKPELLLPQTMSRTLLGRVLQQIQQLSVASRLFEKGNQIRQAKSANRFITRNTW